MGEGAPGERDLARLAGLALAALAAGLFFQALPGFDLWISGLFAEGRAGFPWSDAWVLEASHRFVNELGLFVSLFVLFGLAWTFGTGRALLRLGRRGYAYLTLVLALGPGLLVNGLLKAHWGRARPRDVEAFGGEAAFTPALERAGECAANCSFVSGDVSFAAALLAFSIVLGGAGAAWARLALVFTGWIAFVRVAQGAHFLSDVVFAALLSTLLVVGLKLLVLDRRWGFAAGAEAWGAPRLRALARWREESFRPGAELAGLIVRDLTAGPAARARATLAEAGLLRLAGEPGATAHYRRPLHGWADRLRYLFWSGPGDFGMERAPLPAPIPVAEPAVPAAADPEPADADVRLPLLEELAARPGMEEARADELARRFQMAEDAVLRRKA